MNATVERPPEGRNTGADRRVEIGATRAYETHGRSGAVLLVVRMQDQQDVQRFHELGVGFVGRLRRVREHHVQEVRAVLELVARIGNRSALPLLIAERSDRAYLRQHSRDVMLVVRVGLDAFRIICCKRAHHRREDRHWMRARWEAIEEMPHVLVQHAVIGEQLRELLELRGGWQLPVDEEIARLDEGRRFGKLLDWIAAVEEDAFFTVDVGDRALSRPGVHETGVERDEPGVFA
jgi:hypothetical protein